MSNGRAEASQRERQSAAIDLLTLTRCDLGRRQMSVTERVETLEIYTYEDVPTRITRFALWNLACL